MASSECSFSHFESEANEGSYSSPLHSPSHRHSESDGGPPGSPASSSMTSSSLTGGVALQKVRQIASTQGEVLPFTPDGIYALAKVAELFVDHLLRETMELHDENIDYDELADTIQNDEDLSFLHDFFPTRITFEEAQAKMAEKIHDDDD